MYMIEISEHKADSLIDYMSKGMKFFGKAIDCLEEAKEESMNERDEDDWHEEEEMDERRGMRGSGSRSGMRGGSRRRSGSNSGGGRYFNY